MGTNASRTVCIVPARGGSKRVPRKNVRSLAGVPVIARTLATIIGSEVSDRVVVSTDDDEIAEIAVAAGADVPFRRPAQLADDHTPTAPVIVHALATLTQLGDRAYDHALVVYPTAVLLSSADLRTARDAVVGTGCSLAFSVCRFSAPIERAWRLAPDGTGEMRQPEFALTRTQDLEPSYFDAGQYYFGTVEFWEAGGSVASVRPRLVELPAWRIVDIDTEEDLERASLLLHAGSDSTGKPLDARH